jgi:hypothetical protein
VEQGQLQAGDVLGDGAPGLRPSAGHDVEGRPAVQAQLRAGPGVDAAAEHEQPLDAARRRVGHRSLLNAECD